MNGRLIFDAFQTGETVLTGAVLVVGFLSFVAALLLFAAVWLLFRLAARYRRAEQTCQAFTDTTTQPPARPVREVGPAVLDLTPGMDLGLQDDCALIYDMPAREPGPERLMWAIRREQQKGD
jgi:hypothetical protein